jgi:hypothetical protein
MQEKISAYINPMNMYGRVQIFAVTNNLNAGYI